MDNHVISFFSQSSNELPRGNFHKVISLQDAPDVDWETVSQLAPGLCKGWYELAHLSSSDRVEFTCDYWLNKLPYHSSSSEFLPNFFRSVEDVGVYLTQQKYEDPFEASLVYCLKEGRGFYRGGAPATDEDIRKLQHLFSNHLLPADYQDFLKIHNGFWKATDCTGIAKVQCMENMQRNFQNMLSEQDRILTSDGVVVNPRSLIPFYESFGMPFFQCFWADWYPEEEMGNVYYSATTGTVLHSAKVVPGPENMSFPTFLDWLVFYLEQIT